MKLVPRTVTRPLGLLALVAVVVVLGPGVVEHAVVQKIVGVVIVLLAVGYWRFKRWADGPHEEPEEWRP